MTATWLWYYTRSIDETSLRELNEARAAAVHARGRRLLAGAATLASWWRRRLAARRERRLERILDKALDGLSDRLLRDIGRSRHGTLDRPLRPCPAPHAYSLHHRRPGPAAAPRRRVAAPTY